MRDLRTIRIFLATLFFIGSAAFLIFGPHITPMARGVEKVQIVPSLISVSMGAILIWLVLTFLLGRVYCSTVCPIGTLQDLGLRMRRLVPHFNRPFSWRKPNPLRHHILVIYAICLLAGVSWIAVWIEPWNIMRNICGAINPSAGEEAWMTLGVGMATGIAGGAVSAILLLLCGFLTGRAFCTDICPIGTALGAVSDLTLLHIEIDPDKCINCMECENVCRARCVKVADRIVDNSRCIRCFDCLKVCPNDAIRFQAQHNRRGTPLMNKVGGVKQ